jgi:glycine dehydrogenase
MHRRFPFALSLSKGVCDEPPGVDSACPPIREPAMSAPVSLRQPHVARDFADRHIGPAPQEQREMLDAIGIASLDELIAQTVPASIRMQGLLSSMGEALSEVDALARLRELAGRNQVFTSLIGQGYSRHAPAGVIQRNILENPAWYTAYTPYQPEISQGRLEALLNFQTMICELTGLDVANASLLDEGTAAAEAMARRRALEQVEVEDLLRRCRLPSADDRGGQGTRAEPLGWNVIVGDPDDDLDASECSARCSSIRARAADVRDFPRGDREAESGRRDQRDRRRSAGADPADAARRTRRRHRHRLDPALRRADGLRRPARRVHGGARRNQALDAGPHHRPVDRRARPPAARLSLQTREQHIRREKATSNICTAQVLLAVIASMYAIYHGPEGLRDRDARASAHRVLAAGLRSSASTVDQTASSIRCHSMPVVRAAILEHALAAKINLRQLADPAASASRWMKRPPMRGRSRCGARSAASCAYAEIEQVCGATPFPPTVRARAAA